MFQWTFFRDLPLSMDAELLLFELTLFLLLGLLTVSWVPTENANCCGFSGSVQN